MTVFEISEVVGTGRLYLLSIAVLAAVTKLMLILRSNNIVIPSSGEASRDRGVHEEAGLLRLIFPGDGEDARLPRGGSSSHSCAREGQIEDAWVGEEQKQLLDIQGLPTDCLNDIL